MSVYNILIVDDKSGVVTTYKGQLNQLDNFQIHTAASRVEAYEILKGFRKKGDQYICDKGDVLALAILDQNLEDQDYDDELFDPDWSLAGGLTLIQEIKLLFLPTRVVVLTAYQGTEDDMAFEAAQMKADSYLQKGNVEGEHFKAMIREQLQAFDDAFANHLKKSNATNA
ncbi:MAG: response regulator [Sedimenticola sp.]